MRSKPIRKNPNKERVFSLKQNILNFDYLKTHRGKVHERWAETLNRK